MQDKITQAVILSAGLGRRLRPLTAKMPKVMLPLAGKPLLGHHIGQLKKHGVKEFFINLHYLPGVIQDYFEDGSKFGVKIKYALEEPEILGTAGGVKNFEDSLGNGFFVVYGDVFSLMDYSRLAESFLRRPEAIGMGAVGDTDHPEDSDWVEVDQGLRILKIHPKPHKNFPSRRKALRGIFVFNKKVLAHIPKGKHYEIDHELLPAILARGEAVYGYETNDYLKDIGSPQRYEEVKSRLKAFLLF